MKWAFMVVVMVVFVFKVKTVTGLALTTINCLKPAIKGVLAELNCRATGFVEHGISWYRPDGKKVVVCSEKTQQCLHAPGFEGKYAGVMSTVVDYVLKIIKFEPDIDSGSWSCSDGDLGPKSSCDKAIGYKLVTSIDCKSRGLQGKRTELQCSILKRLTTGVYWFRPDGFRVAVCNYAHTRCRVINEFKLKYICHVNSVMMNTLIIRSFSAVTDAGEWYCQDGPKGEPSKCTKLVKKEKCILYCQNGGTVLKESCSCYCPAGWSGSHCEYYGPQSENMIGGVPGILAMVVAAVFLIVAIPVCITLYNRKQNKDQEAEDIVGSKNNSEYTERVKPRRHHGGYFKRKGILKHFHGYGRRHNRPLETETATSFVDHTTTTFADPTTTFDERSTMNPGSVGFQSFIETEIVKSPHHGHEMVPHSPHHGHEMVPHSPHHGHEMVPHSPHHGHEMVPHSPHHGHEMVPHSPHHGHEMVPHSPHHGHEMVPHSPHHGHEMVPHSPHHGHEMVPHSTHHGHEMVPHSTHHGHTGHEESRHSGHEERRHSGHGHSHGH